MRTAAFFASMIALGASLPVRRAPLRREVPQEHSHDDILAVVRTSLNLNNPDQIQDPVFGLLGNAAGSAGQGKITNTDCLQQATADQAFTNAKAAGDIAGMTGALQYRALERNTGSVGLASVLCTAIKATNPEIAAISQHQDPASPNAAATNKAIVLELAKQLAGIGADPTLALATGTFAPGTIGDPTAKGNSCDTPAASGPGCIVTENLLVDDATVDEINAAVAGITATGTTNGTDTGAANIAGTAVSTSTAPDSTGTACSLVTITMTTTIAAAEATTTSAADSTTTTSPAVVAATTTTAAAPASTTTTAASTSGSNLQTFTGALGGIAAPPVTAGGKGFETDNAEFLNLAAALGRSCDVQHNQCANLANSGGQSFKVNDCDTQDTQCKAAGGSS